MMLTKWVIIIIIMKMKSYAVEEIITGSNDIGSEVQYSG